MNNPVEFLRRDEITPERAAEAKQRGDPLWALVYRRLPNGELDGELEQRSWEDPSKPVGWDDVT